jgi:hypothetical protein
LQCFSLVHSQEHGEIRKITDFYKCQITSDQRLGDLKRFPKSDELTRLRIALDRDMQTEPYWDLLPVHDYGKAYWMNGEDWFRDSVYTDATIMKFRFSSRMRCFGYRKGERFRLLRIERDHKRSNKG